MRLVLIVQDEGDSANKRHILVSIFLHTFQCIHKAN